MWLSLGDLTSATIEGLVMGEEVDRYPMCLTLRDRNCNASLRIPSPLFHPFTAT